MPAFCVQGSYKNILINYDPWKKTLKMIFKKLYHAKYDETDMR